MPVMPFCLELYCCIDSTVQVISAGSKGLGKRQEKLWHELYVCTNKTNAQTDIKTFSPIFQTRLGTRLYKISTHITLVNVIIH